MSLVNASGQRGLPLATEEVATPSFQLDYAPGEWLGRANCRCQRVGCGHSFGFMGFWGGLSAQFPVRQVEATSRLFLRLIKNENAVG